MGILSWLRKKLSRKKLQEQEIQSDSDRFGSIQSAPERSESLQIDKESLKLGFAAGYTGRALRTIEDSLIRIESLMPTKEQLEAQIEKVLSAIEKHDQSVLERFEAIRIALDRLESLSSKVPQPLKSEIFTEIQKIREKIQLTPRMEKIVAIIKERKEISYKELASLLGYKSESTVRGLLSQIAKQVKCIQRFTKDGKGWVKYVEPEATSSQQLDNIS